MINSKGEDTSILFGFTKILLELILKEKPTHLAVAFDPPAKTFRHELYNEYKANRSETPELIKGALKPLIEIIQAMSIPVVMKEGFEADDVIGTLSKEAEKKGYSVYMVTPDKDYGQLVSQNIFQYKPAKNGNESEIIGKEEICTQYGIERPEQVIDILTIWGDASDNIPGVKGVGEVGSKKLVQKYGSVQNIYESINELPEKLQNAFTEAKSYIDLSKRLVTIDTAVDIPFEEEAVKLEAPHFNELKNLFNRYEFNSLKKTLSLAEQVFNLTHNSETIITEKERVKIPEFQITTPENVLNSSKKSKQLSVKIAGDKIYLESAGKVAVSNAVDFSKESDLLKDNSLTICGYDLKNLLHSLLDRDIKITAKLFDIELMHYILMPERAHKPDILARSYLGIELAQEETGVQTSLFDTFEVDNSKNDKNNFAEVSIYKALSDKITEQLKEENLFELYDTIEMPLIYVLADIEHEGFKIDTDRLNQYSSELKRELDEIDKRIKELAGDQSLNISSPKQLGVILFEKLKLVDKAKTTSKKNYSTDEETLMEIRDKHPIIALILEYRNIKKLISTYVDPLPTLINPKTGKIHTTFNQALTATGRLSSIKPNLQNIPIRNERGREIRKSFIPSNPDGLILSADYSQIELRIMAHLSGDSDFIDAFNSGKDIHTATAAKIFKVSEQEVTKEQRSRAKTANFGIIYGISAFGLSQRLQITRSDSKKLIDDYFGSYPKVMFFINDSIEKAKQDGYVKTIYGRKRYLPDINSKNPVVRGLAERNAINAPIQGSAADIIKMAMVRIHKRISGENFTSKMILQVHDELVFDIVPGEAQRLSEIVKNEMENVIKLSVPLTVECDFGKNWLEAH